ncbi:hypothetical protein LMG24238_00085 [Paraburkholderia sediminicola]|uniref:Uncharacterized protein n=1 Tax=Paraburkholderia sediminicola TaxID=458836 RepID=A0A6J4ZXI4_9BURK|nr:hypothetical protein [Paraburkholderia sediminicola]CAB3638764.1 hypothetical protein LMG24238_00085 [Paraburkholderia sediminicola]
MKRSYRIAVFLVSLTLSFILGSAVVFSAFAFIDRQINPPELVGPGYADPGLGFLFLVIGMPSLAIITTVCARFLNPRLKALANRWL